jgi:hypothetical protein
MNPHPVKQPNLTPTRKFPLTDMPTGLMAAWSRGADEFGKVRRS